MKKIIVIVLSAVLLFSVSGCQKHCETEKQDAVYAVTGNTQSDFTGISLQIEAIENKDGVITLTAKWINDTAYDVVYGESYRIEYKEGDTFTPCSTIENATFTAIGYALSPKSTKEKVYTLTNTYDIQKTGQYRFGVECFVYDKGGQNGRSTYTLWAEFTLLDAYDA